MWQAGKHFHFTGRRSECSNGPELIRHSPVLPVDLFQRTWGEGERQRERGEERGERERDERDGRVEKREEGRERRGESKRAFVLIELLLTGT